MIQARIHQGQVELQEPIPPAWEGQLVKLVPLTPEDPVRDVEQQLTALHKLGPMEFEPGEREAAAAALEHLDVLSKQQLERLPSRHQ